MILATTLSDTATLIAAVTTLVIAITGLRNQNKIRTDVSNVHKEVTTANGLTLAMLADAQETRRVERIDVDERTDIEQEHVEVLAEAPEQVRDQSEAQRPDTTQSN